ncbi:unnamed protein product, partial [Symbiodinium necroappetens]
GHQSAPHQPDQLLRLRDVRPGHSLPCRSSGVLLQTEGQHSEGWACCTDGLRSHLLLGRGCLLLCSTRLGKH